MILKQWRPLFWLVISILMLGLDYFTGPAIHFPIAFAIPVLLAAWYSGWIWGVGLAVLLPITRAAFHSLWEGPTDIFVGTLNLAIRIVVLAGVAVLVNHAAALTREIKVLKGMLPTCSGCKKIQTEDGSWKQMESYIAEHSQAEFSHGLCDECAERLYPDFYKKMKRS